MKCKVVRKIMALGLSLTLSLSMLACGNSGDSTKESGSGESGQTQSSDSEESGQTETGDGQESSKAEIPADAQTVTVWSNNRHDSEYVEAMIKEFNETNELGIYIDYVIQTDNYQNMLTMAATSGQAPDVMAISASDGIDLKTYVEANIIQPITDLMSDEFIKVNEPGEHMYEGLNSIGDDIYWVPTGVRSGSRLIYNAEILDEAGVDVPTTLAELVEASAAVTEAGNGDYYGVIFPGQSGPFGRWLEGIAQLSGVTAYDYANGCYNFDGFQEICEAVREMFDEGSVFPGSASMKIDPIRAQFAEGTVAFHGNASQEVGVLTEQFPMEAEWGVADLPTMDGEIKGALSITPNLGWMVSATCEQVDLAWEVIEFFGSEEFLKGYLEGGYTAPISTYMSGVIDSSLTGRLADFELQDYEDVYPTLPEVTPEGEVYADALWNACLSDGPDIAETIATLNQTYNDALDKAVSMGKIKRLVVEDYDPLHPSAGTCVYLSE